MKSNELFEQIHSGRIKEKSKINVYTEEKEYITTIEYKNGRLEWKPGDFDTRFLCDIEIEFEVEENKEIEELIFSDITCTSAKVEVQTEKINELVRAVNKLRESEEK